MVSSVANRWKRSMGRSSRRSPRRSRRTRPGKFRCPNCKREYGDPHYHGPIGHAPQELCFDCWASEWAIMEQVMSRGGNWQQLDAALFLLCQGFTHREAGDILGVGRRTVYNWIQALRRRPHLTPRWLADRAPAEWVKQAQVARTKLLAPGRPRPTSLDGGVGHEA